MGEIHLNDIGTNFEITILNDGVVVDISSATTKEIKFKKSNGSTFTQSVSFVTDGTDGKIKYLSVDGDLDLIGIWQIQARVVLSSGTWSSETEEFEVFANI